MHLRNAAERLIITFKDQFIVGIWSIYPDLPMQNLDRLLEQADIILNFIHLLRLKPKLSVFVQLNGTFD